MDEDRISYKDEIPVYRSWPKFNKTIVPVTSVRFVCEPELKGTGMF